MRRWPPLTTARRRARPDSRHAARRRRAGRTVRVHAQGSPDVARRDAVPDGRAARPHRLDRRRARSATPTCSPGRFQQGELVRVRGRVERFREQLQVDVRAIASAGEGGGAGEAVEELEPARFLPVSKRDLDELEGFVEHLARRGVRPRRCRRCCRRCWPTRRCARSCDARPARSRPRARPAARRRARAPAAITPTSAACSSTPSPSPRSRSRLCTLHPRLDRDLLLAAPRSFTTSARRASTATAPRSSAAHEGRMLGHVELGLRSSPSTLPTRSTAIAASRSSTACCCTTAPTRRAAGASSRRRRSRWPPQRARRAAQGRARARPVGAGPALAPPPAPANPHLPAQNSARAVRGAFAVPMRVGMGEIVMQAAVPHAAGQRARGRRAAGRRRPPEPRPGRPVSRRAARDARRA